MDIARRRALGLVAGCALLGSAAPGISKPRPRVPAGGFTYTTLHDFSPLDGPSAPMRPTAGVLLASDGLLYGLSGAEDNPGTAFRLATTGGEVKVIHRFGRTGTEGKYPAGELLEGPDGHFYGMTTSGGAFRAGTAFRMHPNGFVRVLHDFADSPDDGAYPAGPPLLADDGWFYGVTAGGGKSMGHLGNGRGTVYRLKASGEYELLHSFTGTRHGGDGSTPIAPLVQAADGLIYGLTVGGGAHECGSLFRINGATGYEVLYSFAKDAIGRSPLVGLTLASDGFLYGATSGAGGKGEGTIFRLAAGGQPERFHTIDWVQEGGRVSGRLVEGPDGFLYFALAAGGINRHGAAFRLDRGNGKVALIHAFDADTEGAEPEGALAVGPDGSLYGTLFLSPGPPPDGPGLGAIYRLTPA